jgi:hypothetical protein
MMGTGFLPFSRDKRKAFFSRQSSFRQSITVTHNRKILLKGQCPDRFFQK